MNQDSSTTWHQSLHGDPIFLSGDDDLSNLLHLELDFPGFEESQAIYDAFDNPMGDLGLDQLAMGTPLQDLTGSSLHSSALPSHIENSALEGGHPEAQRGPESTPATTTFYQPQRQYQIQRRKPNHRKAHYESRAIAPPTPQSTEIQGAATYSRYANDDGITEMDLYQGSRDDPMTFTPLVSPAVTPIDPNQRLADSMPTVPGEYFSPLTSPAMEAQNRRVGRRALEDGPDCVAASFGSPPDLPTYKPVANPCQPASRRSSRRPSVVARPSRRSVRQSPLSKPQRHRKPNSMATPQPLLPEQQVLGYSPLTAGSPIIQAGLFSGEVSAPSSISPEPLSDALMPPPSIPRTVGRSPILVANGHRSAPINEPATPATLMRLQSQEPILSLTGSPSGTAPDPGHGSMEDIALPESAAGYSQEKFIVETGGSAVDDAVLRNTSAKTPKLSASSTPGTAATKAQLQSNTDGHHKRPESRPGQNSKSRPGGASSQVSPAIRPKISPSIKPMMPNTKPGTPLVSAESSALYLASKSNYQNILEGTHLPGVLYPETLAENLSSKRTSHKLAEQGRRNRINVALKEMEQLLPQSSTTRAKRDGSGSGEGDSGDRSTSSNNSKASTVELAINYIKALQAELCDTRVKLEDREKKLAENNKGVDGWVGQ